MSFASPLDSGAGGRGRLVALERPVLPFALEVQPIDVLNLTRKPLLAFVQSTILSAGQIQIPLLGGFPLSVHAMLLPVSLTGNLRAARN